MGNDSGETPTYLTNDIFPKTEEDQENFLDWLGDCQPFHIGSPVEANPARQIKCKKCGSVEFHVGMGDWYTAIRCAKCLWEMGIHEG